MLIVWPIQYSGGGGIRTLGTEQTVHRFSKPALSTTQAPLRMSIIIRYHVRTATYIARKIHEVSPVTLFQTHLRKLTADDSCEDRQ